MKIIMINPKNDFSADQVASLESAGGVVWIEDGKYQDNPVFSDPDEKIIAISPEAISWEFPNEFIDKIVNLKAICVPTTDFAWLDGEHLRQNGIIVTNVSKYSTESVAEYLVAMMLNVAKKLPLIIKNDWGLDYDKHQGHEVKGKTMGVVGLGSIGARVAQIGKSIGMGVVYWSKNSRNDDFKFCELDDLLKTSDFVFATYVIDAETKNFIDKSKLDLMKSDAFFASVNWEEGFDLECALSKVADGSLAGLAFESEKKKISDYEGNVWVTPPIAWFTREAADEDMRIWVDNVLAVANGQAKNVVN